MVEYLRAKNGFVMADRTVVKGGQVVPANDRVVKGREHLFEPFTGVETATRAPNERRLLPKRNPDAVVMKAEKRRRARPAKKAAAPPPAEQQPSKPPAADPAKADD